MGPHVLPVRYDPRLGTRCFAHIDDKDEVTLLLVNMDGEYKEIFVEGQPPLSLSLSLSLTLSHSHTHTQHTNTRTHSLSLSHTHTHTLSLSHTHTVSHLLGIDVEELQEYHITAPEGNSEFLEMNGVPLRVDETGQVTPELQAATLLAVSVSFLLPPRSMLFAKFPRGGTSMSAMEGGLPWYAYPLLLMPGLMFMMCLVWVVKALYDHPAVRRFISSVNRFVVNLSSSVAGYLLVPDEEDTPHEL